MEMWTRWQVSDGKWTRWWRILSAQEVGEATSFCDFAITASPKSDGEIRFHWRLKGSLRDVNGVLGEYSLVLK